MATAFLGAMLLSTVSSAAPLFPTPLHITRQVVDPISGSTTVFDEYAYGNRLISIRGAHTSIADYEKGELIEIDRGTATYSITRFDAIAKAQKSVGGNLPVAPAAPQRKLQSAGVRKTKVNRSAEFFETDSMDVGVDSTVRLSKEGLEVLLGAAYPGVHTAQHDIAISAASKGDTYALPVEQVVRYDVDGQHLEFRTSVVRVGSEAAPAELIAIPAGAGRVTSRIVAVQEEIDRLTNPAPTAREH